MRTGGRALPRSGLPPAMIPGTSGASVFVAVRYAEAANSALQTLRAPARNARRI